MWFDPDFVDPPPTRLSVIDLTPLCRELLVECSQWGDENTPLSDYAIAMFRAPPVTRIALDVGYSSSSAFNTAFRDLIGQTPTQYRNSFVPTTAHD